MNIGDSLFEGKLICLGPIDHEKDPEIESRWTHDPEWLRLTNRNPARPLSPAALKKKYEAIEKDVEESKNLFYFTIRRRGEPGSSEPGSVEPSSDEHDRLVGYAKLSWIEWTNGNGNIELGIGDPKDRGQGYGSEVLRLLLRYAFSELNLHRLSATIPEYCPAALHIFQKAGFVQEVCRREALNRDGRRWDLFVLGILREEWQATQAEA